jgi:hypothetical protein
MISPAEGADVGIVGMIAADLMNRSFQILEVPACAVTWRSCSISAQILVENALYYMEDA